MENCVKKFRELRSKTQSQLAREVGCKPSFIHQIEAGKKEPSLKTASKLLVALECSFRDLFPQVSDFLAANNLPEPTIPGLFEPETTEDTPEPSDPAKIDSRGIPEETPANA